MAAPRRPVSREQVQDLLAGCHVLRAVWEESSVVMP